jgi:hypothetical protein
MKHLLRQLLKSKSYISVSLLTVSVTAGIYYGNDKKISFRWNTINSALSYSSISSFSSSLNLFPLLRLRAYCEKSNKEKHQNETVEEEDEDEEEEPKKLKKPDHPIMIEDDTPENDAKWEEEKQHCSFCKSFLTSPCKEQFKKWSKCVDKAKEMEVDFIEGCSHYTKALMSCTEEHNDYFMALHSKAATEEEKEEEKSAVGMKEPKEEKVLEKKVEEIVQNNTHLLHGDETTIAKNTSISAVEER